MRARKLVVAGLVTMVVLACSKPPEEVPVEDVSLALFASTASGSPLSPVASAAEIARPQAPSRGSATSRATTVAAAPLALEALPELKPAIAVMEAPAILGTAIDVEPIGAVAVAEPAHDHSGEAEDEPGRNPGIIIRGGTSGSDPCKIHPGTMPGIGDVAVAGGVLINDRAPAGVGRNNPALNPGRASSPQRGTRFPGGIR